MTEHRRLDAAALAGLAHPLRMQLMEALTVHGSATASELARRLGESSGATSYHLRQLERHGFVEEDPGRGSRRERWWRVVPQSTQLRESDFEADPAMAEAHRLVSGELERGRRRRHDQWLATRRSWPSAWREASAESTSDLGLTVEEASQLNHELQAVLMRWAERVFDRDEQNAPEGARVVEVQVNVFPAGEPPAAAGDDD